MSDVTREERDRLMGRVDRIEASLGATVNLVAAEVVGMRTHVDERFSNVERVQLRTIELIGQEMERGDARHAEVTTALTTILDRLDDAS